MEALEQHTGWKALYTIATLPLATVDATQLGELLDTQLRPLFGADMVRLYVADAALSNALRPWVGTEAARAAVLPLGGLPARARQELEARRCFSAVLLDPLILPGDPDAAALHALALAPVTDEAQLLGAVLVGRYVAQPFTVE
ncbi:MAG TPA: hypothetical protein ENN14_00915, partial [Chloroflexi bacterium]|nr:hypothetical protein [Chloroflexota bacterium]